MSYTKEGEEKPVIGYAPFSELEIAYKRSCHIRFDCLVKMYDFGQREPESAIGRYMANGKALPPQWFKSELRITLEAIAIADPYELGMQIKRQFEELQKQIEMYEK